MRTDQEYSAAQALLDLSNNIPQSNHGSRDRKTAKLIRCFVESQVAFNAQQPSTSRSSLPHPFGIQNDNGNSSEAKSITIKCTDETKYRNLQQYNQARNSSHHQNDENLPPTAPSADDPVAAINMPVKY